jgi:DNA-binding transcriptional LysR family regulator
MQSGGARAQNLLRHLLYFMAVAEEEHFHKAAARLNVTQPALSRHVSTLEQEVGTALFVRRVGGVTLTPAGKIMQEHGARMLLQMDHLVSKLAAYRDGREGTLRVGFNLAMGRADVVIVAVNRFKRAYPNATVEYRYLFSQQQVDALLDGSLDVAFIYDEGLTGPETRLDERFEFFAVTRQDIFLCLYDGHPLLKKRKLTFADLRDEPLIWPADKLGHHSSEVLKRKFVDAGVKPNILAEAASIDMALNIVASHVGIGFAPYPHPRSAGLHFRKLAGLDMSISISMVWLRENDSVILKNFIETVKSKLKF